MSSKREQWKRAAANAKELADKARDAVAALNEALSELREVQELYQEWRDNLPESLEGSATCEKLDGVLNLDLESTADVDDVCDVIDEALDIDLPSGFGRD